MADESSVPHDDPDEEGFPSVHSHVTLHTTRDDAVHGCHVRSVYRFACAFDRHILGDEKDAHGADGKTRENAYAYARTAPFQTLIYSDNPLPESTSFF